jgi:hypothetical protein
MGLEIFDTYDVQACTDACRVRADDSAGGPCVFVNIWRAENAGVAGTTTCSFVRTSSPFYDIPTYTATGSTSRLPMSQPQPIPAKGTLQLPSRAAIK